MLSPSFRRGWLLRDGTLVGDLGDTSHSEAAEQAFREAGIPMPDYGRSFRARIAHAQREARLIRIAIDPEVSVDVDIGCEPTDDRMYAVGLLYRALRPLPVVWELFDEDTGAYVQGGEGIGALMRAADAAYGHADDGS
jgi:hypothetical protein